jgi:hypothetical protein
MILSKRGSSIPGILRRVLPKDRARGVFEELEIAFIFGPEIDEVILNQSFDAVHRAENAVDFGMALRFIHDAEQSEELMTVVGPPDWK